MYIIPPLQNDELFQSWLIKICEYNDYKLNCFQKIKELNSADIRNLRSRDILNICIYLNRYINCDFMEVIHKHTLLPYITPFADNKKILWEKIKLNYLNFLDNAKNYHYEYFKLTEFKVCIDCIEEESNSLGGAYIHRSHQIPGNYFCEKHKRKLKISRNFYDNTVNFSSQNLIDLPEFEGHFSSKFEILSKDIYSVAQGILSGFTIDYIKLVIWIIMEENGYINNMIINQKFIDKFYEYYDYYFLEQLQCVLHYTREDIFDFDKLTLKPGQSKYSPIQMILIIRMLLNGGMGKFVQYSRQKSTTDKLYRLTKLLNLKVSFDLVLGTNRTATFTENLYDYLLESNGIITNNIRIGE